MTLPLVAPSLAAGAVLCWARALGEFGATITFAGNIPGRDAQTDADWRCYRAFETNPEAAIALSLVLLLRRCRDLGLAARSGLAGRPRREEPLGTLRAAAGSLNLDTVAQGVRQADGVHQLQLDVRVAQGAFELRSRSRSHPARCSAVLGPNGAGKTTLLRALAGLAPVDGGTDPARRSGARRRRHRRMFVPAEQRRSAWCSRTTGCSRTCASLDNVAFGPRVAGGEPRRAARARRAVARSGSASPSWPPAARPRLSRRPGPAGGARPRAGRRAGGAAARRAARRARRADPRRGAGRAARAPRRLRRAGAARHPRPDRGAGARATGSSCSRTGASCSRAHRPRSPAGRPRRTSPGWSG